MTYNKSVGLATITAIGLGAAPEIGIGATVRLRNLGVSFTGNANFDHQFSSALDDAVITGGDYIHNFVAAQTGAVNVVTGSLAGSQLTPTNAVYSATSGDLVITVGSHGLSISDTISFDANSMTFTCQMDGGTANKTYPRTTDPAYGVNLPINSISANTFTVNVGPSPIVNFNVSDATYNQVTGDMTMTIGVHQLDVGTSVKLLTEGLIFKCSMDGYLTDHAYPRATAGDGSPDPAYNTRLAITAATTDTITVNVGTASSSQTINGKFPAVHTQASTFQFPVQRSRCELYRS